MPLAVTVTHGRLTASGRAGATADVQLACTVHSGRDVRLETHWIMMASYPIAYMRIVRSNERKSCTGSCTVWHSRTLVPLGAGRHRRTLPPAAAVACTAAGLCKRCGGAAGMHCSRLPTLMATCMWARLTCDRTLRRGPSACWSAAPSGRPATPGTRQSCVCRPLPAPERKHGMQAKAGAGLL